MTDVELLEKHRGGCDEAFADLVRRHLGWVYGVARRRLRDAHLAEDVAQAVFVLLHRKMPRFPADGAMMSWLHRAAWYAAEVAARSEKRRQRHETEAAMIQPAPSSEWQELAPMLDELVGKLNRADREAILLRYYREMTFAEVGTQIGSTEEAARKRVDRAVEKLRQMASQKGMNVSAAVLTAGLLDHVCLSPPAGLIATATGAATAATGSALTAASIPIVKGATLMMASQKIGLGIAVAVGVLLVGGTVYTVTSPSNPTSGQAQPVSVEQTPVQSAPVQTGATLNLVNGPDGTFNLTTAPRQFSGNFPTLSPFTGIRWPDDTPEVEVAGQWYLLATLNEVPIGQIVQFARVSYPDEWQKRFAEDLIELMMHMGHPMGDTADLLLTTVNPDPRLRIVIIKKGIPMTRENRQKLWQQRQSTQPAP